MKTNSLEPRFYDQALYQARHSVENFFAKLKPFRYLVSSVILLA